MNENIDQKIVMAFAVEQRVEIQSYDENILDHNEEANSGSILTDIPELDEHFKIIKKIGEGTFSCVYLAKIKSQNDNAKKVALKCIVPTSHPFRVENELYCLQKLGGKKNIIGLLFSFRHEDHNVLAMPYFNHDRFVNYFDDMSLEEIQLYIKNLLIALNHVHSHNIIHRDIKPSNFLYNRHNKKFALVDFGLSQRTDVTWTPIQGLQSTPLVSVEKKNSENRIVTYTKVKRKLEDLNLSNNSKTPPFRSPLKKRMALGILSASDLNLQSTDSVGLKSKIQTISSPMNTNYSSQTAGFKRLLPTTCSRKSTKVNNVTVSNLVKPRDNKHEHSLFSRGSNEQPRGCNCFDKWQVCKLCTRRRSQVAARAGTPGFRAPEVLLKHPHQTTAVDIWSAGVIFLCILSKRYPFFTASDDIISLAEIISLFGEKYVKEVAFKLGKSLICKPSCPPLNIRKICQRLRRSADKYKNGKFTESSDEMCINCHQKIFQDGCICLDAFKEHTIANDQETLDQFPDSAYDLLEKLLKLDFLERITAEEALNHPFLRS